MDNVKCPNSARCGQGEHAKGSSEYKECMVAARVLPPKNTIRLPRAKFDVQGFHGPAILGRLSNDFDYELEANSDQLGGPTISWRSERGDYTTLTSALFIDSVDGLFKVSAHIHMSTHNSAPGIHSKDADGRSETLGWFFELNDARSYARAIVEHFSTNLDDYREHKMVRFPAPENRI